MHHREASRLTIGMVLTILFLSACGAPAAIPSTATATSVPPTATPTSVPPAATTTSPPPTAVPAFPAGLLLGCPDCGSNLEGYTEIYNDDGTLVVYRQGKVELEGKWYLEGDVMHTGDSWCHDEDSMPASYRWHFDGESLVMERIKDHCVERFESLQGKRWRPIEASAIPMGTYSARDGEYILELGDDYSFTLAEKGGAYNTSGMFSANGSEITWETDSYCDQNNSGTATYTWTFEDEVLLFSVKGRDKCVARLKSLLLAYRKME